MTARKPLSLRSLAPEGQPRTPTPAAWLSSWRDAIAKADAGDPAKLLWLLFERTPSPEGWWYLPIPDELRHELVESLCNRTWSLAAPGGRKISERDGKLLRTILQAEIAGGLTREATVEAYAQALKVDRRTIEHVLDETGAHHPKPRGRKK